MKSTSILVFFKFLSYAPTRNFYFYEIKYVTLLTYVTINTIYFFKYLPSVIFSFSEKIQYKSASVYTCLVEFFSSFRLQTYEKTGVKMVVLCLFLAYHTCAIRIDDCHSSVRHQPLFQMPPPLKLLRQT